MTPERLAELATLPLFPRTARDLMRVAGVVAAAQLITAWPGQEFPVPQRRDGRGERRFEQLLEIVGEPAALAILAYWRGQILFIPNCKEVLWSWQQGQIRADYDRLTLDEGYSHPEAVFALGIEHNVTGRAVELVLKRPDNPVIDPQPQGTLF